MNAQPLQGELRFDGAIYGCSYSEALALNGGVSLRTRGGPARAYLNQRNSANHRGIAWEITFPEWMKFWTGKLHLRGVTSDKLCMARKGDVGPYSLSNVYLSTVAGNCSENWGKSLRNKRPANPSPPPNLLGTGKGWSYQERSSKVRPYVVLCASKYVGRFATQAEAEAAYRAACEVRKLQGAGHVV